jgi:hypothetical protein
MNLEPPSERCDCDLRPGVEPDCPFPAETLFGNNGSCQPLKLVSNCLNNFVGMTTGYKSLVWEFESQWAKISMEYFLWEWIKQSTLLYTQTQSLENIRKGLHPLTHTSVFWIGDIRYHYPSVHSNDIYSSHWHLLSNYNVPNSEGNWQMSWLCIPEKAWDCFNVCIEKWHIYLW